MRIGTATSLFFFFLKAGFHHLSKWKICKITVLGKSAILYFYVKIKGTVGLFIQHGPDVCESLAMCTPALTACYLSHCHPVSE